MPTGVQHLGRRHVSVAPASPPEPFAQLLRDGILVFCAFVDKEPELWRFLQNASGPSPVRMIAPTPESSRARSRASEISISVSGRKALRTSGRSIVILAMPSPDFS